MDKTYNIGAEITVIAGEATVYKEFGSTFYEAICECNHNTLLIAKSFKDTGDYDIIKDVLEHVYDTPLKYLANYLNNHNNAFVFIGRSDSNESFYTIYEYTISTDTTVKELYQWMKDHNDYASDKYLYTIVKNGHQEAINFENSIS